MSDEGDDYLDRLRSAREELADARDAVDEVGEARLAAVRDAYREATDLLDRYEGRATGTGDFAAFVEFQEAFVELVEGLDDDLPARDAFEEANDHLDQRRLGEDDFEEARETLRPVADRAALLADRERAEDRYETARRDARKRLRDLDERIDHLERLQRLGEADLDAPVERLRDPIESYDDAVTDAWTEFRREASAREVFRVVEASQAYPLAAFQPLPPDLREYVTTSPAGEESIPTLLEYADYSSSKLSHYVDDPGALRTRVATHRTYLERLDAEPLTVSWPPPSAERLRYRASELVSVVARFAPEAVVAQARRLRRLPDEVDYERLRETALARDELDEAERERLERGAVEAELTAARDERERIEAALSETADA
ncbi:DUF7118 family protein [Haloplanus aerogenes]|uniref:Uncharacterized protein n=1 Tax=Haloplanus aerogenes TaxID=660522 RepID=A0A3M0CVJ0_9EURY|nr:hypothetical protein [Haloplanus aerogenes]AZH23899.1 hypothetical protein DU502_00255 [Haloplanus aerogenes]RMB13341.1 hypothetical protein ATH50_2674 [Haloplanus aerogenes]